jgi:hypothetical protein
VEVAEQLADTNDNSTLLWGARNQIDFAPYMGSANQHLAHAISTTLSEGFYLVGRHTHRNLLNYIDRAGLKLSHFGLPLFREIFGNPFRPVDFAPWRTGTAVALARQMYNSRDFGAMPILADALQDAGCDNDEVLSHCRAEAAHFRGCWVVDGVLGLE